MSSAVGLSEGVNESERVVYDLLCRVFMPTNVFANPIKSDGRELCDVLVRLLDHAFLVSVRDRKFNNANDERVEWGRWSRESIGDKIKSLTKGGRYLRSQGSVVYLDSERTSTLPLWIARTKPEKIHKIIVGFGIPDSIAEHKFGTAKTIRLQLMAEHRDDSPFTVGVVKSEGEPVHVFDIEALRVITQFADTPLEFNDYLYWREKVIAEQNVVFANGEEDLLAAWMLKRFKRKPLVDPEDFRDELDRLPAILYLGIYEQFKRSSIYRWKMTANERSGFWNDLTVRVADGAFSGAYENADWLAAYAGFLSLETKYLRAYTWHELERKADEEVAAVDVLVISSVLPDLVYYFSVQHEAMLREHRTRNTAFMAHAIAGQMKCNCLAVGLLARDPLRHPAIAFAEPPGSPIIHRDMSSIKITIDDALRWLAAEPGSSSNPERE